MTKRVGGGAQKPLRGLMAIDIVIQIRINGSTEFHQIIKPSGMAK